MKPPSGAVTVSAPARADGRLSVRWTDGHSCVLSNGQSLQLKGEKMRNVVESLCQDCCAVSVRSHWTKHGKGLVEELLEIHDLDAQPRLPMCPDADEVF